MEIIREKKGGMEVIREKEGAMEVNSDKEWKEVTKDTEDKQWKEKPLNCPNT